MAHGSHLASPLIYYEKTARRCWTLTTYHLPPPSVVAPKNKSHPPPVPTWYSSLSTSLPTSLPNVQLQPLQRHLQCPPPHSIILDRHRRFLLQHNGSGHNLRRSLQSQHHVWFILSENSPRTGRGLWPPRRPAQIQTNCLCVLVWWFFLDHFGVLWTRLVQHGFLGPIFGCPVVGRIGSG